MVSANSAYETKINHYYCVDYGGFWLTKHQSSQMALKEVKLCLSGLQNFMKMNEDRITRRDEEELRKILEESIRLNKQ